MLSLEADTTIVEETGRELATKSCVLRCNVRPLARGLQPQWRASFLQATIYQLLKDAGENSPFRTRAYVEIRGKAAELSSAQFRNLPCQDDGSTTLELRGPCAEYLCRELPRRIVERSSQCEFDSDGFCAVNGR